MHNHSLLDWGPIGDNHMWIWKWLVCSLSIIINENVDECEYSRWLVQMKFPWDKKWDEEGQEVLSLRQSALTGAAELTWMNKFFVSSTLNDILLATVTPFSGQLLWHKSNRSQSWTSWSLSIVLVFIWINVISLMEEDTFSLFSFLWNEKSKSLLVLIKSLP